MSDFDTLAEYSHLPIVDLTNPGPPRDGLLVPLSRACRRNYAKGDKCQTHYRELAARAEDSREPVQCPYGFASAEFRVGNNSAAVTGFVPYPRLGGDLEKKAAKDYPEVRVTAEVVQGIISTLKDVGRRYGAIEAEAVRRLRAAEDEAGERFRALEEATARNNSMALHEIRKLNRTVVQTAERLCIETSPHNPELADRRLVTIWKTAELMSKQFDVVELLANESLTKLPVKAPIQLYKIFDKVIRVYQAAKGPRRMYIQSQPNYTPWIHVCEKTFPIIPTVLISNALKYSSPGSEIVVDLLQDGTYCVVRVASVSDGGQLLNDSIFDRGVRASADTEGSGNGLYVAQLVARQHGTSITVESTRHGRDAVKHIFRVPFRTFKSYSARLS